MCAEERSEVKEVSCRGIGFFFEHMDRKGIPRERLVEGLPYSLDELTKTGNWISWELLIELERRMRRLFPDDPNLFFDMGRGIENTLSFGIVRVAARRAVSPVGVYKMYPYFLEHFLFPFVKIHVKKTGSNSLYIQYRFQEGYAPTEAFTDIVRGFLTGVPAMLGAPYADVKMIKLSEYAYDFDIQLAQWKNLVSGLGGVVRRVKRVLKNVFLFWREGMQELEESNRILEEKVDALNVLGQHLEARVKERTAMLKKRSVELERANEDLSILTTDMEDLLHAVAHDLKSPLINIQGFAMRLAETVSPIEEKLKFALADEKKDVMPVLQECLTNYKEKGPQSLQFIEKGIAKMDVMIQGLLRLSRENRTPEPMTKVNLNQVIEDIQSVVSHQLEEKHIQFIRHEMPTVTCRKNAVNQVFSNLIVNAMNYMGDKPEKRIEVDCHQKGDDLLEFTVQDTGVGIKERDIERVFRIFTRLGETKAKGDGIGLNIVKKMVRGHGGTIWVTSIYGEGSTFHFTIPLSPKEDGVGDNAAAAAQNGSSSEPHLQA